MMTDDRNKQTRAFIIATIADLFGAEINPCELCAWPFRCTICGDPDLSALILFTSTVSFCSDCLGTFLAMPGKSYEWN